ncbi:MAG: hypothetical protein V7L11_15420 [Nostoc sp.]|uniref:hypothetical protein n=1 Tax=Nostoc sp. TaxID=1180 RepID=UPI002FFB5798
MRKGIGHWALGIGHGALGIGQNSSVSYPLTALLRGIVRRISISDACGGKLRILVTSTQV